MTTLAPSPPYLGPPYRMSVGENKPIQRIVVHSTVSPCVEGGARSIADYFKSKSAGGSAHYVVDPGEVVQVTYDSVIAWHAPPNPHSIGIEMCDMPALGVVGMRRWKDDEHKRMLVRTARLTAQLCLAYDVPARRLSVTGLRAGRHGICGHVDVSEAWHESTHWDPGAFPWAAFIRLVKHHRLLIKQGDDDA